MATRRQGDDWPDFTASARLQFWTLPQEAIEAFAAVFPEFTQTPLRPSPSLDVGPIRNDPRRWRLRVAGYRALYHVRHGWPIIERILPRTVHTYQNFRRSVRPSSK